MINQFTLGKTKSNQLLHNQLLHNQLLHNQLLSSQLLHSQLEVMIFFKLSSSR